MADGRMVAALDPSSGRIVGFVVGQGGKPGWVEVLLDGSPMMRIIAAAPAADLGRAGVALVGLPPVDGCAFAARLPADAEGRVLRVTAITDSHLAAPLLVHEFESDAALARFREGSVMADFVMLENLRFQSGKYRASLRSAGGGAQPSVHLVIRGEQVGEATLTATDDPSVWAMSASVPPAAFSDGVYLVEFQLSDGSVLTRHPIAAGAALSGDLASEVASLRVEIDQLKRSFRKAMAAGVLTRDERPMIVAEALTQVDNMLEMRDRRERQVIRDSDIPDWDDDTGIWEPDE